MRKIIAILLMTAVASVLWADEGLYCIIDLSGGTNATQYTVSYLDDMPLTGWTDDYKTEKLVLRYVGSGSFSMGTAWNLYSCGDETQHTVVLTKGFYIGVFEVTQKQYELVMGENPSLAKGDLRPVENLSWYAIRGAEKGALYPTLADPDADTFIGRLQAKTGLRFDLPTEAQWEYACRAGNTKAYVYGSDSYDSTQLSKYCRNYNNQSDGRGGYSSRHTVVGSYLPNAWGLYDMCGNVWEWTLDNYVSNLGSATVVDPIGPASSSYRVIRGGGWNSNPQQWLRMANRNNDRPDSYNYGDGFRLALATDDTRPEVETMPDGGPYAEVVEDVVWNYMVIGGCVRIGSENVQNQNAVSVSTAGDLVIPSFLGGCPVTSIGSYAFKDCTSLTSVVIPASVTNLGFHVFTNCGSLMSIQVDEASVDYRSRDGVLFSADGRTLLSCPMTRTGVYEILNDVTEVGVFAFEDCAGLSEVKIPSNVKRIQSGAFYGCRGLSSLLLPEGVTDLCYGAFVYCTGLTSITIPASVTNCEEMLFGACTNLIMIDVAEGSLSYKSEEGVLFSKEGTLLLECPAGKTGVYTIPDGVTEIDEVAFGSCAGLSSISLPDSVTKIGSSAFESCKGLTSLTIPASVTYLGYYACWYCSSLVSITFMGNDPCSRWAGPFYGCNSACTAYVPRGSTGWGVDIPGEWNGIKIAYLPEVEGAAVTIEGSGSDRVAVVTPADTNATELVVGDLADFEGKVAVPRQIDVVKGVEASRLKVVNGAADLTPYLVFTGDATSGYTISVDPDVVKEALTGEGAAVSLDPAALAITTAATKEGLTYTFAEGTSLKSVSTPQQTHLGDGVAWSPTLSTDEAFTTSPTRFFAVGVRK